MGVPDLGGAHKAPSDQLQSPCPFQCCKGGWRFSQQSCPTPPPNLPLGQFTPSLASSRFPTSQKSQGQRGFLSLIESIPPPQYRDEKIKSQRKERLLQHRPFVFVESEFGTLPWGEIDTWRFFRSSSSRESVSTLL